MAKTDIREARREVANDLRLLERALKHKGLCLDTGPLLQASNQCENGVNMPRHQWGYRLDKLKFLTPPTKRSVPNEVYNVAVELTVDITSSHWNDSELADPFDTLDFNVVLRGEYKKEAVVTPAFFSWHLDRHISDAEDEIQNAPSFLHPLYHFQQGGHRLWTTIQEGYDYGSALILEAPRLMHPPMDAVLGIDFVLTNYFPLTQLEVRDNRMYAKVLVASQRRCWRPYVHALSTAWMPPPQSCKLGYRELWPQLP